MINKVKKVLALIPNVYQWAVSWFIAKENNIWVFGAIRGQKYMDNAKYIFEYVHNNTDIDAIWICKNSMLVKILQQKGFKAYHEHSSEAKYFSQRAKIAVITHRGATKESDLPFYFFSKKTKIIQLWHGIPLKKIAFDDKIFSNKSKEYSLKFKVITFVKNFFFPFLDYVHNPSLVLALSNDTQDIFTQAFRVDKELVKITGYPRTDILLSTSDKYTNQNKEKIIIYMPTFRGKVDSSFDLFLDYGFDVDKLDKFLDQNNMKLDIKLHPFNNPSNQLMNALEKSSNITLLEYDAIYEILNSYDILITDYSSIYFDYLLLNRPIIFAPFDQESYLKNDREFYFNYEEVTPGPKASSWDEILQFLTEIDLIENNYIEERNKLKDRFHFYQDTNNTKRVYKAIKTIANE